MTDKLVQQIAGFIRTKEQKQQSSRGLLPEDHAMFRRALAGYEETEIKLAYIRKAFPEGYDERSDPNWRPNRRSIRRIHATNADATPKDKESRNNFVRRIEKDDAKALGSLLFKDRGQ